MRYGRRLLGWITYLGFLAAVGVITFHYVRYSPRCVIRGPHEVLHLADGGTRLLTATIDKRDVTPNGTWLSLCGPIHVWDSRTGVATQSFVKNCASLSGNVWKISPDGQYLALVPNDKKLRLIDWRTGAEQAIDIGEAFRACDLEFSPDSAWLCVQTGKEEFTNGSLLVVNVLERKLALGNHEAMLVGFAVAKDRVYVHESENTVTARSLSTAKQVDELQIEGSDFKLLPDGRTLEVRHCYQSLFRYERWDLVTGQKSFAKDGLSASGHTHIQPLGGQFIFLAHGLNARFDVQLFEPATGRNVVAVVASDFTDFGILQDNSLFWVFEQQKNRTTVYDAATGQALWSRPSCQRPVLAGRTGVLMHQRFEHEPMELLDVRTGQSRGTTPYCKLPNPGADIAAMTPDCRYCALWEWRQQNRKPLFWETWLANWRHELFGNDGSSVVVIETTTGQLQYRLAGHGAYEHRFSEDGSCILTVARADDSPETAIRVWDVHPHRAWTWALAASAGTGLGLWGLRRSVRWLRRQSAADPKQRVA